MKRNLTVSKKRRKKKKKKRRKILLRIALRRFRHNLRKKQRKNENKARKFEYDQKYKEMAKGVKSFQDAINVFLPRNLSYLLGERNSPLYSKTLPKMKMRDTYKLVVPEVFSIITTPKESFDFLRRLAGVFIQQSCHNLWLDYGNCKETDLLTQVFLDAIMSDIDKFLILCKRANICSYINLGSIGGVRYDDEKIRKMVNSVGSPAILINRKVMYKEIIPFRLQSFDGLNVSYQTQLAQKEIDTTKVLEYVNKCLGRVGKTLNDNALREMGYVIGETLINAEEHSSLSYRYLIGYFEECKEDKKHYGIFNLVIMNFGKSIYEKFKYPEEGNPINQESLLQMKELSSIFTKKKFFSSPNFTEETLWTLYSLQQGVTCVPNQKRGNGTIQFIESFFRLKGEKEVDNISRMYILSGNTVIEFDGKYRLSGQKDENGVSRGIISFNETGTLQEKPDGKYVRSVKEHFPGTAIFVRLLLNEDDIKNENNHN